MLDIDNYMKKAFKKTDPDKDIEFENARNPKKRKKKKILIESEKIDDNIINDNKEGLQITGKFPNYVDFNKINKSRGYKYKKKENIDEWNTFDFFEFARRLYIKKYNKDWILNRGGNSLEIKKIFTELEKKFKIVNNLLMYDYIIYFFERHINNFIRKNGDFYFSHMKRKDVLKSFYNSYNYKSNLKKSKKSKKN